MKLKYDLSNIILKDYTFRYRNLYRTSCRFHPDIMRRGKWKTIRRNPRHPCRNIQGIPVRTADTGQAIFRGLDGTSRSMAGGQGFRVRTYPTGHAVAFPHRYAQRVPLAARFHPYGIFPSGAVETAHLSRGAGTERTLLSIRRRRGAASLRAGNTPVLRLTGQPHGIPGRQGTAPVGVPHASLRDTAQGHTRA